MSLLYRVTVWDRLARFFFGPAGLQGGGEPQNVPCPPPAPAPPRQDRERQREILRSVRDLREKAVRLDDLMHEASLDDWPE